MAWVDPRYLEHQRKRFTRADAYRFAPPGTPEAKIPGCLHPSARIAAFEKAQEEDAAQQAAAWALERELLEVRRELDEVKLELAARHAARLREDEALRRKSDLAWDHFIRTFKRYAAQQKPGSIRISRATTTGNGPTAVGMPARMATIAPAQAMSAHSAGSDHAR